MKNKLLDNVSFIVGAVAILAVFFCRKSLTSVAIVGSVGMVVYGLVNCINSNRLGGLFISIGGSLLSAVLVYRANVLEKFESITFFICMSMALMVIVAAIIEIINVKSMLKRYSIKVDAKVVDLVKNPNTKQEYYQPIYEYVVDQCVYTVGAPGYINKNIPKIGDIIKIHVNPNDKEEVYFERRKSENIHMLLSGLFFFVVSIIIIISLF